MISALAALGPWVWIIMGLLFMLVELLAPGLFFIWLGLAALATGLAVAALGLGYRGDIDKPGLFRVAWQANAHAIF
jgi:membrane-bound ClpP family serine protease